MAGTTRCGLRARPVDTDTCKPADNNKILRRIDFVAVDGRERLEKRKTVSRHFDVVNAAVYFSHCPRELKAAALYRVGAAVPHTHAHTLAHNANI